MTSVSLTGFSKDIHAYFAQSVLYNESVTVTTDNGNAVVISEDEYNGLLETLKLYSMQGTKEDILCGKNTPLEQCVPAEDVVW